MTKTKEFLQEVILDTFCTIYEKISKENFKLEKSLEAYFLQSCKYALWGRSKENSLESLKESFANSAYSEEGIVKNYITPEKEEFFRQHILPKLSERKRRILELTYEGYNNPEIAQILGNSVASIKSAKSQAMSKAKEIAKTFPNFFETE